MSTNGRERQLGSFGVLTILAALMISGVLANSASAQDSKAKDAAAQKKGEKAQKGETKKGDDKAEDKKGGEKDKPELDENPFRDRMPIPRFDFPKDATWINSAPLKMRDLKGKFVIFDFWTYCCINCIHILPELKKLEKKYPNQLVVIGIHSAKFETEKVTKNIKEAVLRYEIEHPVINDADHRIWNGFGIRSWPSLLLIDPEGFLVGYNAGEIQFEDLDQILKVSLPYYRKKKLLDEQPFRFELLAHSAKDTPLRFPGKVMADEAGKRLFITDSNHNRIVVTDLSGKLLDTIGSGAIGRQDGGFEKASFDHPQGVALHGDNLYVADTENHMLRKVDLKNRTVTTIAGTGAQSRRPFRPVADGKWAVPPKGLPLNSPWALWVHKEDLYIAMAGPHQIWRMKLNESEIGPYAGNGREDIVDGGLLPTDTYALNAPGDIPASSFAQPSGLASDGEWLFVADSEGSSIRAVPFDTKKQVRTVVGTAHLPQGRLFEFGDIDGKPGKALLQHALGVVYHDGTIYVADTYNNKLKTVDAESGETKTLVGTGKPGYSDKDGLFDEPAGISYAAGKIYIADTNNHVIRVLNLADKKLSTLKIAGLKPPKKQKAKLPTYDTAKKVDLPKAKVSLKDGELQLNVKLALPSGWKINELAPMEYRVMLKAGDKVIASESLGVKSTKPGDTFTVPIKAKGTGPATIQVGLNYFYCQKDGTGLCKMGSVLFTVPLEIGKTGKTTVGLNHSVKEKAGF